MKTEIRHFAKPRLVSSKCLEFDNCRYNGVRINDAFVRSLMPHVDFIPLCPEVEIGLGVPRDPIRIVTSEQGMRLVQPSTGRDVTSRMNNYIGGVLENLPEIDGFILKHRSPSCGPKDVKIYPGMDSKGSMAKGSGLFAGTMQDHFPDLPIEDEGRLLNLQIREHFLTRIFANAELRKVGTAGKVGELVSFHASYKLILMSYNQAELKNLGKIVANPERRKFGEVYRDYVNHFHSALSRLPRITANINVLMHALGYFKKELNQREKGFFLDSLERYRNRQIPLSAVLSIISVWIARTGEEYLEQQRFFQPFPQELVDMVDSGRGKSGR